LPFGFEAGDLTGERPITFVFLEVDGMPRYSKAIYEDHYQHGISVPADCHMSHTIKLLVMNRDNERLTVSKEALLPPMGAELKFTFSGIDGVRCNLTTNYKLWDLTPEGNHIDAMRISAGDEVWHDWDDPGDSGLPLVTGSFDREVRCGYRYTVSVTVYDTDFSMYEYSQQLAVPMLPPQDVPQQTPTPTPSPTPTPTPTPSPTPPTVDIPEMTGEPIITPNSVSSGESVMITVPVTTNTDYVAIRLLNADDSIAVMTYVDEVLGQSMVEIETPWVIADIGEMLYLTVYVYGTDQSVLSHYYRDIFDSAFYYAVYQDDGSGGISESITSIPIPTLEITE